MTTYFITLEPLEPFFFGMEKLGESGNKNDYYQKSSYYPQQTAILGMLRYILGDMNEQAFTSILIGEKSFDAICKRKANYGVIDSISPVFIVRGSEKYIDSAFDESFKIKFEEREVFLNNVRKKYIPIIEVGKEGKSYDAKKGIDKKLKSSTGESIPLSFNRGKEDKGVFSVQVKEGNQKSRDGKSHDAGYFKYEYVSMNDAHFGFYATFSDNDFIEIGLSRIVFLGGNRSPFRLTVVEEVESTFFREQVLVVGKGERNYKTIRLLSDTYLEPSWVEKADFAITELVGFRNLQTSTEDTKYWNRLTSKERVNNKEQPYFSERFNLLKKGSVLYFVDTLECQNVEDAIKKFENFRQIGYNQFITI